MSDALMEAAQRGLRAGAERLAAALRATGAAVTVDGDRLSVTGLAREFGTAGQAPDPAVGRIVAALGPAIAADVAVAISESE